MIINYTNAGQLTRGLVVGKFAPPHLGHNYLIEQARLRCDELTVLVVDTPVPGFEISAQQRALWLAQIHNVTVDVMPDILFDDRSDLWAEYTEAFLGYVPDVVFSSESYGQTWADELGCAHYEVDMSRSSVPISATEVRAAPLENLSMLHPVVRAAFVKRVAVVGAESTGTTTLAKSLADYYQTEYVPEFGRLRDERARAAGKSVAWTSEEFAYTAVTQQAMEDRLARTANKVLVCDTDALATALWHERYHGYSDPATMHIAELRGYDLYIVTSYYDVPAVDDGFRFEMYKRPAMQQRFVEELDRLGRKYVLVTGRHAERMQQATKHIDMLVEPRVDTHAV